MGVRALFGENDRLEIFHAAVAVNGHSWQLMSMSSPLGNLGVVLTRK